MMGADLTRWVSQAAKEFDAEEELVPERVLFEFLYGTFCLRCGEMNPTSARFCQRCGGVVERDEDAPKVVDLTALKVLAADE